jgi:5-formyltetrahydrofolate cyclo-ligase
MAFLRFKFLRLAHAAFTAASMTHPPQPLSKEAARRAVKEALRRLGQTEMAEESAQVAHHLRSTGLVAAAKTLCIYVHCAKLREVDTSAVLAEALAAQEDGRSSVFVPRVQDSDSNMHFLRITSFDELEAVPPFGILEPYPQTADGKARQDVADVDSPVDLVVMPGLAFDRTGRRLGRGGGYYDKFLAGCWERASARGWHPPLLAALAYRSQIIEHIPMEDHDKPIDILITADGVLRCSERARKLELPLNTR